MVPVAGSIPKYTYLLNISTTTGWIAMKFCTSINFPHGMTLTDFDDPLTFHLVPPAA